MALAAALAAGCPARFDPRADTVAGLGAARSQDPRLDEAWGAARARFDGGDPRGAREGFAALRAQGSAAEAATLWEARCDLALGEPTAALPLLEPLSSDSTEPDVRTQARFLLGLALARVGDAARAEALLTPFVGTIVDGEDAGDLHASLAAAASRRGQVATALAELERFYPAARPAERTFVRAEASRLAGLLDDATASAAFRAAPAASLTRAVLGGRLAATAEADEARWFAAEAQRAGQRFGLQGAPASGAASVRPTIGLVLPLSGRSRLVGERVLRGALLAAGLLTVDGRALELRVRDSASKPERAAAAIDELVAEGVLAVVGSPERAEAAAVATRTEALGLPLFDLSPDAVPGPQRFPLIRPNTARAEALAGEARRGGARRAAIVHPDTPYGRRMAEAFAAAFTAAGGAVVAQLHFDEKATTFIAPARQLATLHPDAVFVPSSASQLELLASQLATSEVTASAGARHRAATLYATADGAGAAMLARAGRYLQGAVLAPVFFGGGDTRSAALAEQYRAAFLDEPGAADALAYDAVRVARDALDRVDPAAGAAVQSRRSLAALVSRISSEGMTGPVAFLPDGRRGGIPMLLTVEGDHLKAVR